MTFTPPRPLPAGVHAQYFGEAAPAKCGNCSNCLMAEEAARQMEQRAAEAKQRAAASARRLAEKPRRRPADVELSAEDESCWPTSTPCASGWPASRRSRPISCSAMPPSGKWYRKSHSAPTSCSTSPAWARRKPPATARSSSPPSRRPSEAAKNKTFRFPRFLHRMWKTERFYNAALHCNFAVLLKLAKGSPFERLPPAGGDAA